MTSYLKNTFDINQPALVDVLDEIPLWSGPFGIKLLENIVYKKNITALDIGFGTGFPLTEVAMRLGPGSKVIGIDPWKAATVRAKQKLAIYGIHNVDIINGQAEKIPLPDHSTDLIISNNGLNNVTDLAQALNECKRVIKPGGQFVQTVNLPETMMTFYSALEQVLKQFKLVECIADMHHHIYEKRKPLDEYIQMLGEHGFSIRHVLHDEFNYHFTDGTAMLNHYFIRLAFLDSWKALVPAEKHHLVFSNIESILNKKAEAEGSLTLAVPFVVIDCKA